MMWSEEEKKNSRNRINRKKCKNCRNFMKKDVKHFEDFDKANSLAISASQLCWGLIKSLSNYNNNITK